MKIRMDYVTNSSSSSFVVCKKDIGEKAAKYIDNTFTHVSCDELYNMCRNCEVDDIYYLVDYESTDEEMHIWVKRDESMNDDEIDDILYDNDRSCNYHWINEDRVKNTNRIKPKFNYHY